MKEKEHFSHLIMFREVFPSVLRGKKWGKVLKNSSECEKFLAQCSKSLKANCILDEEKNERKPSPLQSERWKKIVLIEEKKNFPFSTFSCLFLHFSCTHKQLVYDVGKAMNDKRKKNFSEFVRKDFFNYFILPFHLLFYECLICLSK